MESKSVHLYGEKVTYTKNQVILFPDFSLQYLGNREQHANNLLAHHEFEIRKGKKKKGISWLKNPLADIGPQVFEFIGKKYVLELEKSEKVGFLKNNELVVWSI